MHAAQWIYAQGSALCDHHPNLVIISAKTPHDLFRQRPHPGVYLRSGLSLLVSFIYVRRSPKLNCGVDVLLRLLLNITFLKIIHAPFSPYFIYFC